MNDKMFRKSVIDRLSSPEQNDKRFTIIKPYNWIVVVATAIILLGVAIWGFFGTIPEKVGGNGMLVPSQGLVSVRYPSQGIVRDVFVETGSYVTRGMVIARIERQDLLSRLQVAKQKLEDAQKLYIETSLSFQKGVSSSSQYGSSTKSSHENHMKTLDMQITEFSQWEKNMKVLFDDGIISQSDYLNMKKERLSAYNAMEEARREYEAEQRSYDESTKVLSSVAGTVLEVSISRGDFVNTGGIIAFLQEDVEESSILEAKVYFSDSDGKKVKPGMKIGVVPSTVKQEEYGYIQGIVTKVSKYPVSGEYLLSTFHSNTLAQYFSQIAAPLEVTVSLIPDSKNYSGYKWSSSKGPSQKLSFGIMCSGSVIVREQKPITLLIPYTKRKLLGVGDEEELLKKQMTGGKKNNGQQ